MNSYLVIYYKNFAGRANNPLNLLVYMILQNLGEYWIHDFDNIIYIVSHVIVVPLSFLLPFLLSEHIQRLCLECNHIVWSLELRFSARSIMKLFFLIISHICFSEDFHDIFISSHPVISGVEKFVYTKSNNVTQTMISFSVF